MFRYFAIFSVLAAVSFAAPLEKSDQHLYIKFNHVDELKEFNENFVSRDESGYSLIEVYVDLAKDYAYAVVAGNEKLVNNAKAYLDEKKIAYEVKDHDRPHGFKATVKMSLKFENGKRVE